MAEALEGLKNVINRLKDMQDKVDDKDLDKTLMAAAQVVKEQARSNAPVDTGRLQNSIVATYGKPRGKDGIRDVVVLVKTSEEDGAPYAYPVEFGSSKQPGHSFMRPAVKQTKGEVKEILTNGLKEILKNITKGGN